MDTQPYGNVIVDASAGGTAPDDPFGTAAIRRRVLDAWAASPARFREDANAEEDAARGAYHDRLVVELLQNAVDAAQDAGADCRVLITLTSGDAPGSHAPGSHAPNGHGPGDGERGGDGHGSGGGSILEIANTGAALSVPGVESLSTLRASAKRDTAALGRFGVGFAAVLAVSDTPSIVSRDARDTAGLPGGSRGVRWSKRETIDAVGRLGVPALDTELARRGPNWPAAAVPSRCSGCPCPSSTRHRRQRAMTPSSGCRCATPTRPPWPAPCSRASTRRSRWSCPGSPRSPL
ncbi:hypothetical protein FrCorBMG51_21530 [Protofrankia coriariae]|uniref:Uncharacterized protein n=1 Tax=Protofrankia coriariae TaxID=1562887 RepID=A0ABR5EZT7_9ACTN|nr:hypothetical protein FrCorBMG51_21530 [Protofrankia coriariae]